MGAGNGSPRVLDPPRLRERSLMMTNESSVASRLGRLSTSLGLGVVAAVALATPATGAEKDSQVTFSEHVAPILQRSCQSCHRPGSVAPMSLITYEETRPWARSIKDKTALREMPPWFIDKDIGIQEFKDDISLSEEEIATFAAWADTGAPRGNPADLPPPLEWPAEGVWTIGEPDLIVSTPVMTVPAVAADYHDEYGPVPTGLTEDRYVKAVEVHEIRLIDEAAKAELAQKAAEGSGYARFTIHHMGIHTGEEYYASEENRAQFRLTHEIGQNATIFPDEVGVILPADSELKFTVHLYAAGVAVPVRADIGFTLHPAGYEPKFQSWEFTHVGGVGDALDIRAGDGNARFDGFYIMPQPGILATFEPHMHASGRRMCLEAVYPDESGRRRQNQRRRVLNCADYDHNWAKVYVYEDDVAPLLPKGAVLHLTGWYDNTPANRNVPDPAQLEGKRRSLDRRHVRPARQDDLSQRRRVCTGRCRARGQASGRRCDSELATSWGSNDASREANTNRDYRGRALVRVGITCCGAMGVRPRAIRRSGVRGVGAESRRVVRHGVRVLQSELP